MLKSVISLLSVAIGILTVSVSMAAHEVSPQDAQKRIQASTAVLVDVRTPEEMADGVAVPAQLIPLQDIEANGSKTQKFIGKYPVDSMKNKAVIFYCRSGRRSAKAVENFKKRGYTALNMGGLDDWEKAGLPTRKPGVDEIAPQRKE